MNVRDKVIGILAEQAVLDTSDVTGASTLEDLGIDSLGLVETIFSIEEAFDISSVDAIVQAVENLVKEQS